MTFNGLRDTFMQPSFYQFQPFLLNLLLSQLFLFSASAVGGALLATGVVPNLIGTRGLVCL